jgi:hypothetical protein
MALAPVILPARSTPPANRSGATRNSSWSAARWAALLIALTLFAFAIAGWHPYADDGGLYLSRVLHRLDPTLFPRCRDFLAEPLRLSLFEPTLTALVRLHLPLAAAALALQLASIGLTLAAGRTLLRRLTTDEPAQLAGIALLAAWMTMPVAATSLQLFDVYLTARSLCTPFTLFAAAFAIDAADRPFSRKDALRCAACLVVAFAWHPLMAAYGLFFVLLLRAAQSRRPRMLLAALATAAVALAVLAQTAAPPASTAEHAAALSRYYWFLSQWRWYEYLGILCPAVLVPLLLRLLDGPSRTRTAVARSCIALASAGTLTALLCAQQHFRSPFVARLQPMRVLCSLYLLLPLTLGAVLWKFCRHAAQRSGLALHRLLRAFPAVVIVLSAVTMFLVQRASFPASPHIEWPGRPAPNPWVQAFLWARDHTSPDALFALDARYVEIPGEDAQSFRAISQRSSLPDFSKDGGIAADLPSLAPAWLAASLADEHLSYATPAQRRARLAPFQPGWLVLNAAAPVDAPCPYNNGAVKICPFAVAP